MVYICTILYTIALFIKLYNISTITSLITNFNAKFKISFSLFLYTICSALYIFCNLRYNYPLVDLMILLLSYILLILCIHENYIFCSLKKLIYIVLLYLSLDSVFNSIIKFFLSIFYDNYSDQLVILVISIINCITVLIINSIIKRKKRNMFFQTDSIPKYVYVLILFAIFFSGGLIENQMAITNKHVMFQNSFNKYLTIISIVLLIFIIVSLLLICVLKSHLENTSLLLEKLNYTQAEHYQNMIKLNKDQRKFRHDYRNHMICIQALIKEKQYDDAEQYIQEITHKEIIESNRFFTGNPIADAILHDKSANAEKFNTEILFEGSVCDKLPLSDVCVIFANALDNAIEACEKMTCSDKKIIIVKCVFTQNMQIIQISNPVEKNIDIYNNAVETTKEDKSAHGIGLYNIMEIVKKYNGEYNITCKNKQFVLDIGFQVCNTENQGAVAALRNKKPPA